MAEYKLTVGLEVHAELSTKTKMFCNSKNDPDEERPNVNVCPVCLGYPGTLPVINKEAVRSVLRFGAAVGGTLADYTEFDRKNYFYPDIPKGYQISQYKHPLVSGGELAGVALTRVHLEEDTASSTHDQGSESLVNFNRAGAPLMELVTEPVIHSAEEASRFAKELQLLLVYLDISEANMEKGEMRVEANISVSQTGTLGTKVEVKNLNSFKAVEKAIAFEVARHVELLERGEAVVQETRGWDESKQVTFSQRQKEDSHDYRYFPEPDLPKLFISEIPEFAHEALKTSLPELPWEKRARLKALGLKEGDVEIFVQDPKRGALFEEVAKHQDPEVVKQAASYLANVPGLEQVAASSLLGVMELVVAGAVSSTGAKAILKIAETTAEDPKLIAEREGLLQKNDTEALTQIAQEIISKNQKVVEEYKAGKTASLQYLVGQAMKETKGSGNPQILKSIFESLLA